MHTEYSLVDGVVRVESEHEDGKLRARAHGRLRAAGMPAVALTDQSNLFALVKFYSAALSRGRQAAHRRRRAACARTASARSRSRLVLLCQNDRGYRNLTRLVTRSYLEGQGAAGPLLDRAWLDADSTPGLIALSGAREGDIGRALLARARRRRPCGARRLAGAVR